MTIFKIFSLAEIALSFDIPNHKAALHLWNGLEIKVIFLHKRKFFHLKLLISLFDFQYPYFSELCLKTVYNLVSPL